MLEKTNRVANYTIQWVQKGQNKINNINRGKDIDKNENIKRIKKILQQLAKKSFREWRK